MAPVLARLAIAIRVLWESARLPQVLRTLNFILLANKNQANCYGDDDNYKTRQQTVKEIY